MNGGALRGRGEITRKITLPPPPENAQVIHCKTDKCKGLETFNLVAMNVDFGRFFEVWAPEKFAKKSLIRGIFMLSFMLIF